MPGIENVGHICQQGFRKGHDRKVYVLFSGWSPKTFASFEGAVKFALKNGIIIRSRIPAEVREKAEAMLKAEAQRKAEEAAALEAATVPEWVM